MEGFRVKKYLSKGNIICGIITFLLIMLTTMLFEQASLTIPLIQAAVKAQSDKVMQENDGRIVLVSGRFSADGYSAWDDTFEVRVDAPILRRNVDVYQWVKDTEKSRSDDDVEYYKMEWSDAKPISFRDNPTSKPYQGKMFYSEAMFGEYKLSPDLVSKLEPHGSWIPVKGLSEGTAEKYGMVLENDIYFIYNDIEGEYLDVGDTRIYIYALDISDLEDITVLARQEGNMLTMHMVKDDVYPLGNIYGGIKSAEEISGEEEDDFVYAKWTAVIFTAIFALITALITWSNAGRVRRRR